MKKRIYISVMCQFIVLKTMFALYSAVVVNEAMWPIGVLIEVLLPLIGGFGVCWIVNRTCFQWNSKCRWRKELTYRFLNRLFAVISLVLIGFILEIFRHADPMLPSKILLKMGMRDDTLWGLMLNYSSDIFDNFFFFLPSYFTSAIFTITFAIAELLFVPLKKESLKV